MAKKATKKEERFEVLLTRLEELVTKLEDGDLELEEALAAFEQGVALSRQLNQRLTQAQEKVELLLKNSRGELEASPLTDPREEEKEDGDVPF
jgi:exodeoxyribonuclease VII small subunit